MKMASIENGLLSGTRIADLTGTFGAYGTRLLSDHGATVVRICPLAGDPASRVGPFDDDTGESFFHRFVNANKRSVAVDEERLGNIAFIRSVIDWADIVVEELPVIGGMDELRVAALLAEEESDTIIVSVRPFAEGSALEGGDLDDLTAQAIGGLMSLSGDPDREPLALYGGQSHFIVGVFAATAALLGLNDEARSGRGRHYKVTVQEAIAHTLETAVQYYTTEGVIRGRKGAAQQAGDGSYRAGDGRVVLGAMTDLEWGRLIAWLVRMGVEGAAPLADWTLEDRRDPGKVKAFASLFESFTGQHSCEFLTNSGQANRVLISPSYAISQILRDGQLSYDQFFRPIADSQGRHWTFPGAPYRISAGTVVVGEAARRVGEDTDWFLNEIMQRAPAGRD